MTHVNQSVTHAEGYPTTSAGADRLRSPLDGFAIQILPNLRNSRIQFLLLEPLRIIALQVGASLGDSVDSFQRSRVLGEKTAHRRREPMRNLKPAFSQEPRRR